MSIKRLLLWCVYRTEHRYEFRGVDKAINKFGVSSDIHIRDGIYTWES